MSPSTLPEVCSSPAAYDWRHWSCHVVKACWAQVFCILHRREERSLSNTWRVSNWSKMPASTHSTLLNWLRASVVWHAVSLWGCSAYFYASSTVQAGASWLLGFNRVFWSKRLFSSSLLHLYGNSGNLTSSLVSSDEQLFMAIFNILKLLGLAGCGGRENALL